MFTELTARLAVVDLNHGNIALMERITDLRKTRTVKLPDAIVMARAALHNATVITNDTVLLKLDGVDAGFAAQSF